MEYLLLVLLRHKRPPFGRGQHTFLTLFSKPFLPNAFATSILAITPILTLEPGQHNIKAAHYSVLGTFI